MKEITEEMNPGFRYEYIEHFVTYKNRNYRYCRRTATERIRVSDGKLVRRVFYDEKTDTILEIGKSQLIFLHFSNESNTAFWENYPNGYVEKLLEIESLFIEEE